MLATEFTGRLRTFWFICHPGLRRDDDTGCSVSCPVLQEILYKLRIFHAFGIPATCSATVRNYYCFRRLNRFLYGSTNFRINRLELLN